MRLATRMRVGLAVLGLLGIAMACASDRVTTCSRSCSEAVGQLDCASETDAHVRTQCLSLKNSALSDCTIACADAEG